MKLINDNKVKYYLVALIVAIAIMIWIWVKKILTFENIPDIAVEFHGVIFDILFIGIIISIYEGIAKRKKDLFERKQEIKRYKEEIDDFREWKEDEAKYRILGIIKRLNNKRVTQIDLNNCFLENLPLKGLSFSKSNFNSSIIENSQIIDSSFNQTIFVYADLNMSIILNSNFNYSCNFRNATFKKSIISNCSFKGANFIKSDFESAKLYNVDFTGADLSEANFNGVIWNKVIFPADFDPAQNGMIRDDDLYNKLLSDERIDIIQNKYDSPFISNK